MTELSIQRKKNRNRTRSQRKDTKVRRTISCKNCETKTKYLEAFGVERDLCSASCLNEHPDTFTIKNPAFSKTSHECFRDIELSEQEYNLVNIFVCRDCIAFEIKTKSHARQAKRRAQELKALPAWADRNAILEIYKRARFLTETTGIQHHVDHYYPLQSPIVCGLHIAENLRIITATENLKKGNRIPLPRRETT